MINSEMNELTTYKYTPALIVKGNEQEHVPALKHPFLIPIYQRLYTWEAEHVERLLHDLFEAYKTSEEYFIGAVVTSIEHSNGTCSFELIDGQQRLTTLWLIASVLVKIDALSNINDWRQFLVLNDKPRLNFSGRDSDIKALSSFVTGLTTEKHDIDEHGVDDHSWLKNEAMVNARETISTFFNCDEFNTEGKLQGFSNYLWSDASFVITQLHPNADKERFFDTMNSRGVQLEKHEILKAFMLNGLVGKQLEAYGKAWDLCADIDGYIAGKFQSDFNYGLSPINESQVVSVLYDRLQGIADNVVVCDRKYEPTLEDILKPNFLKIKVETNSSLKPMRYKSPVSFPVFLLHVLRIYVENKISNNNTTELSKTISLDDKKLIDTFELLSKTNCHLRMEFIECLLECRLLLDNFVIKGQLEESHEHANWQITSRLADTKVTSRIKFTGPTWESISMLQSMMHFSPMNGVQRASWLTQTLIDLRVSITSNQSPKDEPEKFLANLKKQDTEYGSTLLKGVSLEGVLLYANNNNLGTNVHRYWFYKLEYCLWELWFNGHLLTKDLCLKPAILNRNVVYRMRAVNSVEHVSPQSKNNGTISSELLDNFGNLGLISVSENSSYSDKDPVEKKASFSVSYSKGLIQSLKMAHIFGEISDDVISWSDNAMNKHGKLMVKILKAFQCEL